MTTTNTPTSGAADLPEALRKSALEIFDGPECSQDVRDAIEWASGFAQAWLDEADATHLRELSAYRLTVENLEREIAAQQPAPFNKWHGEMQAALKSSGIYAARSPGTRNKLTLRWRETRKAVQPAHQWDVGYPPLPDLSDGSKLWCAIGRHHLAITEVDIDKAAKAVDEAAIAMLLSYVDADRAARAQADTQPAPVPSKPIGYLNPKVIGPDGKIDAPGALTYSSRPCGGWTFPIYAAAPTAPTAQADTQPALAHNIVSLSPLPNPAHHERVYGGHGNEIVHSYYTEHQMREYARQEVFRAEDAWQARAQADSVLEDAARLDFLIEQQAYVVSDPDACPGHWLHWARPDGSTWVQGDEHPTPRAAIDAARKQGEKQ